MDTDIYDLVPGKLEESLLLDRIDLGITYEPIPRPGIEYVKVTQIEMGAYVRRGEFPGKDLLSIPFVIPADPLEGAPSGVKGSDGWAGGERYRRRVRYRVDSLSTGLELVRQGLCAIFMPRFVAPLFNQSAPAAQRLENRELPSGLGPVRRAVYVVKRESTPETPAMRQVARAIRESCR
jgi:DNA-binding transcriptional LysR family regulator